MKAKKLEILTVLAVVAALALTIFFTVFAGDEEDGSLGNESTAASDGAAEDETIVRSARRDLEPIQDGEGTETSGGGVVALPQTSDVKSPRVKRFIQVLDGRKGTPIPGLVIQRRLNRPSPQETAGLNEGSFEDVTTDEHGRAEWSDVWPRSWRFRSSKDYSFFSTRMLVHHGRSADAPFVIKAAPYHRLTVRLVDTKGDPVVGATVASHAMGKSLVFAGFFESDAEGRAEIRISESWIQRIDSDDSFERFAVEVVGLFRAPVTKPIDMKALTAGRHPPLELVLPAHGSVEVGLSRASAPGQPVVLRGDLSLRLPEVDIREESMRTERGFLRDDIDPKSGRTSFFPVETGIALKAKFHPDEDEAAMAVEAQSWGPSEASTTQGINLVITSARHAIRGRFVDEDGEPQANRRFFSEEEVEGEGVSERVAVLRIKTDEKGRFTVPRYPYQGTKEGPALDGVKRFLTISSILYGGRFEAPQRALIPLDIADPVEDSDIGDVVLHRSPLVCGGHILRGDEAFAARVNFSFEVRSAAGVSDRRPISQYRTLGFDDRGRFAIHGNLEQIGDAEIFIQAYGDGHRSAWTRLEVGSETMILRMQKAGAFRAKLVAPQEIQPLMSFSLHPRHASASEKGSHSRFPRNGAINRANLQPGTYELEVRTSGGPLAYENREITIHPGETTDLGDINVGSDLNIFRIDVRDPDGEPVLNPFVMAPLENSANEQGALPLSDGSFGFIRSKSEISIGITAAGFRGVRRKVQPGRTTVALQPALKFHLRVAWPQEGVHPLDGEVVFFNVFPLHPTAERLMRQPPRRDGDNFLIEVNEPGLYRAKVSIKVEQGHGIYRMTGIAEPLGEFTVEDKPGQVFELTPSEALLRELREALRKK
jgi:hypothetical protein